jgi:hypothetical protein
VVVVVVAVLVVAADFGIVGIVGVGGSTAKGVCVVVVVLAEVVLAVAVVAAVLVAAVGVDMGTAPWALEGGWVRDWFNSSRANSTCNNELKRKKGQKNEHRN